MLSSPRSSPGAPEKTLLAVLLLALALAGVLAYQAQDAVRSHRRTAEATLRDYAAFASWELGRKLESSMVAMLDGAILQARMPLDIVRLTAPAADAPDLLATFAAVVQQELEVCRCPGAVHDFFVLDLPSGEVDLLQDRLPPGFRAWLSGSLRAETHRSAERVRIRTHAAAGGPGPLIIQRRDAPQTTGPRRSHVGETPRNLRRAPGLLRVHSLPGDPSVVIVHTTFHDVGGEPAKVYGFALELPALAGFVARRIVESDALLPPSLTGGATNEEVLALTLESAGGDILYRSAGEGSGAAEVLDTVRGIGTLVTRVAIRPEVAGALVIGGLPRSRLPLLLGVFVLALGLCAVAALQLRRQRELIRLRSDFIAGVSHELRTPLAQIRLFSELLESDRLRQEQRQRSVRIINEEARRLAYLVENILRFSRTERRANRIAPVRIEVAPLVREIVEAMVPLARSREVRLHTCLREGVTALLDRDAIRQVLLNLLDNAVKYGPRGQRIDVGMEADEGRVRIRVDDAGPGIPPEERRRVWEPYRRLMRDVESATGGSGIGLAIVRELVELHGGEVDVGDSPAGGARFILTLPVGTTTEPPGAAPVEAERTVMEGVQA
jgi:signal transduction histidine kinase